MREANNLLHQIVEALICLCFYFFYVWLYKQYQLESNSFSDISVKFTIRNFFEVGHFDRWKKDEVFKENITSYATRRWELEINDY